MIGAGGQFISDVSSAGWFIVAIINDGLMRSVCVYVSNFAVGLRGTNILMGSVFHFEDRGRS